MLFFLLPYGTDAPIYHMPIATIVVVALNILVYAMQLAFGDSMDMFMVDYAQINPLQWLSSMFMHADLGHLLGNLMFLGIFGIIVEGKVGWYVFLPIYLVSGMVAAAIIQTIMFLTGEYGAMLGASCAIFAIMTVALIWAPENEIFFKFILLILFRVFLFSFEVSVLLTAFGFISWNFFIAAVTQFEMSSATAHLLGVLPGLVFALTLLKLRLVDCEGFDLVSIIQGKRGQEAEPTESDLEAKRQAVQEEKQRAKEELNQGLIMVNQYANAGKFDIAEKRFARIRKKHPHIPFPEFAAGKLIRHYLADEPLRKRAIPIMEEVIKHYPKKRIPMTLSLAKLYVVLQGRPRKGLSLLKTLPSEHLTSEQRQFYSRLVTQAKKMIDDGILEVDDYN